MTWGPTLVEEYAPAALDVDAASLPPVVAFDTPGLLPLPLVFCTSCGMVIGRDCPCSEPEPGQTCSLPTPLPT